MGSSAFKDRGNTDRPPGGAMPARHANPKIIAIGDAIAKRKKSLGARKETETVSNTAEFLVQPPILDEEVKEVFEETDHPFVVAQWVAPHTPCIIRSVDDSSCIRAIVYPGQKKRREFFYSADRLIRIETEEGDLRVTYSYDPYADEWLMIHDGITARMQGDVCLTEAGVLQIEIDQSGSARLEFPDGAVKLANNCYRGDHNRLCPYYKSTKYLEFDSAPGSIVGVSSNYGSLTFSPNLVSATNSAHTASASITLAIGDYVKIVYYS